MGELASNSKATRALCAAADGDERAAARLLSLMYEELRTLAHRQMGKIPPGATLQTTALVHEAYIRLVGSNDPGWHGRGHFYGAAASAMRNILIEQARRKAAVKHGAGRNRIPTDQADIVFEEPKEDILALDEALTKLEAHDPRKAEIVTLRYFAGLTQAETAAVLGLSERTVQREWRYIKAYLREELEGRPRE